MKMKRNLIYFSLAAIVSMSACKDKDDDDSDDDDKSAPDPCAMIIKTEHGPVVNDLFILGSDSTFDASTQIALSGMNKSWDFSTVTEKEADTLSFKTSAGTAFEAEFPTAEFYVNEELYAENSVNGIEILGVAGEDDTLPPFTDALTLLPYDLEMNASISDVFKMEISEASDDSIPIGPTKVAVDSIRLEITGGNDFLVDGCGTVTTPTGTYDCLRVKVSPKDIEPYIEAKALGSWLDITTLVTSDPDYEEPEAFFFENTTYLWVTTDKHFPVVIVSTDGSGGTESVEFLK